MRSSLDFSIGVSKRLSPKLFAENPGTLPMVLISDRRISDFPLDRFLVPPSAESTDPVVGSGLFAGPAVVSVFMLHSQHRIQLPRILSART